MFKTCFYYLSALKLRVTLTFKEKISDFYYIENYSTEEEKYHNSHKRIINYFIQQK
jgi:hypothetical protein